MTYPDTYESDSLMRDTSNSNRKFCKQYGRFRKRPVAVPLPLAVVFLVRFSVIQ